MIAAVARTEGLRIGLAVTAFGFGLRHGVDWDHIAAILDVTSTQSRPRRAMFVATAYAIGHALVVLALGTLAVLTGRSLPSWLDAAMGRIIGVTLLALAVSVVISLVRQRELFRMRSRLTLMGRGVSVAAGWARQRVIDIVHDHVHSERHGHMHPESDSPQVAGNIAGGAASPGVATALRHRHSHHHVGAMPAEPFATKPRTALVLGAAHGIGAETPTQVALFLTAGRVSGAAGAVSLLVLFVGGLIVSNEIIAAGATYGALDARKHFRRYAGLALINAVFSAVVGIVFVSGGSLPTILGG